MSENTASRRNGKGWRAIGAAIVVAAALGGAACSSDPDTAATTTAPGTQAPTVTGGEAPASGETTGSVTPTVDGETTTTTAAPTTTTIPPTTTTTIPLVTEGAIVLVANAAGVPGAAGQLTSALQAVGFAMKPPTDAAGYEESLDASKIYFLPQAEAAAQSLALVLQINSVSRMPTPAPIVDAQVGLSDATILLMLGLDLAGKDIPGLAGR